MSSGDVAVASPMNTLGRKGSNASAPSRRSIISKIKGGEERENPVSNTDALLRTRRPSTSGSQNSGSRRSKGGARRESQSAVVNGDANGGDEHGVSPTPVLNLPEQDGGNNPTIRRRQSNMSNRSEADNQSISSRRSARGVISSILQKSRSRQSSAEPENAEPVPGGRRRSNTPGSRRMSLRLPSFKKGGGPNGSAVDGEETEEGEKAPPVPSIPTYHRQENGGDEVAVSGKKDIPLHPSQKEKGETEGEANGHANGNGQQEGYIGGAMAAVAGAGAAAGGMAAAVAGKVTGHANGNGNGKAAHHNNDDEDDDSDDEFHDVDPELGDIAEGDEDDHSNAHHEAVNEHRGRHRGLSEGEGVALGAGGGAAAGSYGGARSSSPGSTVPESIRSTQAPSSMRGTSGAKRRSGSTPVGGETTGTPVDAKAKKETPLYVREKAARVQRLTYDDVKMDEDEMREDIQVARGALHLFLNSKMFEAEEIIAKHADRKLYYALGDALIAVIKGFMTFEPADLAKAISYCKDSLYISSLLRKPSNSVANFGRFVRGTGQSPNSMASMSIVQRHAELIYAESLLLKAVMGILYSGDFFAFVSEALNMRNAYGIYRSLQKYVEWADKKSRSERDEEIDEDFRSGVHLGNGLISLILGLLPGKVLKIMEVIGYTGDTQVGLETLARAGAWSKSKAEPGMKMEQEGIRRQVCDMGILLYHLVISTFIPVTGVDIDYADKILHYNLDRYPKGVFFLYFSGRLYSTQARAEKAIVQYGAARDVQKEYVQLQHICYWDMALCHMSLTQWKQAGQCFDLLFNDSNWSKCVYSYGRAANMYMTEGREAEAAKIFKEVPGKMQRIAGKSIPMEKYCARKAKKFAKQERLLLPAIEFSYIYHCLTNAPRYSLCDNQLVDISEALQTLNEVEDPSQYHSGADEYWDDYCLAHFLRGVTLRYIAYPELHAKVDPVESPIAKEEAAEQAEISLRNVLESSHRLALDHYLCYFAHYELGRLRANQGEKEAAREQFNLIMSGKRLEAQHGKSKYSMANMCTLRCNGALAVL